MLRSITKRLGLDPTTRDLNRYSAVAQQVTALEPEMQRLTDAELRAYTDKFKQQIADAIAGLEDDARHKAERKILDEILIEAFAVVRETSVRKLGLRHYDVQMIGGQVIHEGRVAEMRTGEGKTLVATLPLYLNALLGRGAHLVTVNDYLARRDAKWMGPIFAFHGMSVGILQDGSRTNHARDAFIYDPSVSSAQEENDQMRLLPRRQAYAADVTYGTNKEFGFDYLRDNMAMRLSDRRQRELHYAIIDEVDNILIDESRTPLIISGPAQENAEIYLRLAQVVRQISPEMYEIDERARTIALNDEGYERVEELLGEPLRDPDRPEDLTPEQARLTAHLEQALRAEFIYKRDKDYLVQGGNVYIVDQNTGRVMPGRRWSDGLHQAVEAKEGVKVQRENMTYATITLQNYYRLYHKLAGMSGTAVTEAEEFDDIYSMDVVPIPTNLDYRADNDPELQLIRYKEGPYKFEFVAHKDDLEIPILFRRKDYDDLVFRTAEGKIRAVMTDVLTRHITGQPLLLGTTSVELSEHLSQRLRADMLKRLMLVHLVRDAWFEHHNREPDGRVVPELAFLNESLDKLTPGKMRPLARELKLKLNPTTEENLNRLCELFDIDAQHQAQLVEVLEGGIRHNVLNAKHHDVESLIIADAGKVGAVTIATNMAGRGVDIKLGGELSEDVLRDITHALQSVGVADLYDMTAVERLEELNRHADEEFDETYLESVQAFRQHFIDQDKVRTVGGLHVIGSERYEARRIDNQLRGRASRQGDPGSSRFYLSLEDDLMRRFGGNSVASLMERLSIDEALPLEHKLVNKTVEQSQTRVEGANFDMRKHLLEYDDVLNDQRNKIYAQRDRILSKDDLTEDMEEMLVSEVTRRVQNSANDGEGWWKLLDWLDKLHPPMTTQEGGQLFSFSLELILDQLADIKTPEDAQNRLMEIARGAAESATDRVTQSVDNSLDLLRERAKTLASEKRELAEMAYEGLTLEARETQQPLQPQRVARVMLEHSATPVKTLERTLGKYDASNVRQVVADAIEAYAGLRTIETWLRSTRRRLGLAIEVEIPDWKTLKWNHFEQEMLNTIEDDRNQRTEHQMREIEALVKERLRRISLSHDDLGKLLIDMSVSRQIGFDARTHQRVTLRMQRFPYVYYAAELLEGTLPETMIERVLQHLHIAEECYQIKLGEAEIQHYASNKLVELASPIQEQLKATLGDGEFGSLAEQRIIDLEPNHQSAVSAALGKRHLPTIYRDIMLNVSTQLWVEYLTTIEGLRTSIGLEAYAQRDPLTAYKSKAFDEFQKLLIDMRASVVQRLFSYRIRPKQAAAQKAAQTNGKADGQTSKTPGRNDPCHCGSGKKYKNCHMKSDQQSQTVKTTGGQAPKRGKSKRRRSGR